MPKERADVTITLTKELYWPLIKLMCGAMEEYPEGTPEHQIASHIRDAVDAQIGHGGKAFE